MTPEDKLTNKILDVMTEYNDGTKYTFNTKSEITDKYISTILDYIKNNLVMSVSYVGVINSSGNPDPVVSDVIGIDITSGFSRYIGTTVEEWSSHIYAMIYQNTFISKGSYLNKPTVNTNAFNPSLSTKLINQSVINSAYMNCFDEDGKLKDNMDVTSECQKSVCKCILSELILSIGVAYSVTNITNSSTGVATVSSISIS